MNRDRKGADNSQAKFTRVADAGSRSAPSRSRFMREDQNVNRKLTCARRTFVPSGYATEAVP
jgi:hypothetical protein